jgi:hypothetical protein
MFSRRPFELISTALLLIAGCSSTSGSTKSDSTTSIDTKTTLISSWRSPTAQPLKVKGAKIAAIVIMSDTASRRVAEDQLARDISSRGGVGVPMYKLVETTSVGEEPIARDALAKADVRGVVVIHPGNTETEAVPVDYTKAPYNSYWDGYYSYGFGSPWDTRPTTQSFVSVETLVYSLAQNQLVWAGRSKTVNPATLNDLISQVSKATATELANAMLLPK